MLDTQTSPGSRNAPRKRDYFSVPARKYARMKPLRSPYV